MKKVFLLCAFALFSSAIFANANNNKVDPKKHPVGGHGNIL